METLGLLANAKWLIDNRCHNFFLEAHVSCQVLLSDWEGALNKTRLTGILFNWHLNLSMQQLQHFAYIPTQSSWPRVGFTTRAGSICASPVAVDQLIFVFSNP